MALAWKADMLVGGGWVSNSLRFATQEEAAGYARDLFARWTLVQEWRAVACDDAVTSTWPVDRPSAKPRPRATGDISVEPITDAKAFVNDLMRAAGVRPSKE
jgi:hypothetical protein